MKKITKKLINKSWIVNYLNYRKLMGIKILYKYSILNYPYL